MPPFPSLPSSTDPALLAALEAEGPMPGGPMPGEPQPPANPQGDIAAIAAQIADLAEQLQALVGGAG